MKERTIAITKKGYDILRIIEISKDKKNCEFKICPQLDANDVNICYMNLFSEPKYFDFDRDKKLEITYHKSNSKDNTKIHLKLINKENEDDYIYKDLPLTKLLDLDQNSEIPIPLFQIIVPDNNNIFKEYKRKKEHVQFEIYDNNVVEFYLTRNGFINSNLFEKWENLNLSIIGSPIQLYATGLIPRYYCQNIFSIIKNPNIKCISKSADITKDFGFRMNTIYNENINTNKMSMLFIENGAYLGFLSGIRKSTKEHPELRLTYKYDLDNEKFFNEEERQKWEKIFQAEFKKLDQWINESNGMYDKQFDDFYKSRK